jgi:hypothetical protein
VADKVSNRRAVRQFAAPPVECCGNAMLPFKHARLEARQSAAPRAELAHSSRMKDRLNRDFQGAAGAFAKHFDLPRGSR